MKSLSHDWKLYLEGFSYPHITTALMMAVAIIQEFQGCCSQQDFSFEIPTELGTKIQSSSTTIDQRLFRTNKAVIDSFHQSGIQVSSLDSS